LYWIDRPWCIFIPLIKTNVVWGSSESCNDKTRWHLFSVWKTFFTFAFWFELTMLFLYINILPQKIFLYWSDFSCFQMQTILNSTHSLNGESEPFESSEENYLVNGTGNEEMNTTICSNFTASNLTSICRFWLQGVVLFIVGLFGIIGNSVSIGYLKLFLYSKIAMICNWQRLIHRIRIEKISFLRKIFLTLKRITQPKYHPKYHLGSPESNFFAPNLSLHDWLRNARVGFNSRSGQILWPSGLP